MTSIVQNAMQLFLKKYQPFPDRVFLSFEEIKIFLVPYQLWDYSCFTNINFLAILMDMNYPVSREFIKSMVEEF